MAESSEKISPSKRPLHFLLRCFGSSPKVQREKNPAKGRRDRRVPSLRFRFKKSSATVPVDAAVPCDDEAYFSPEFKKPPMKSRAPAVRAEIIESIKPTQTRKKTKSTQSDSTAERLPPAKRTTALLHSVSVSSTRLKDLNKPVSHLPSVADVPTIVTETSDRRQLAPKPPASDPAKKFDPVIVIVAVAILVLGGRFCATLCTAALFYLSRRLRSEVGPDGGDERRVLNRNGRSGFGKIS